MYVFDYFLCVLLESLCEQAQAMGTSYKTNFPLVCVILFCLCHALVSVSNFKSVYTFSISLTVFFLWLFLGLFFFFMAESYILSCFSVVGWSPQIFLFL